MATAIVPVPGLELLVPLSEVMVKQKNSIVNEYVVSTREGQVLYHAKEDATTMGVLFGGGKNRNFTIQVFDVHDQEVFRMRRPMTWGPANMEVMLSTGQLVSIIRQKQTSYKRVLYINDARDYRVLKVKSDGAVSQMESDFYIYASDGTRVGVISKKWGGFKREFFSIADNFEVKFPPDLDASFKAVVISTCFLIIMWTLTCIRSQRCRGRGGVVAVFK